MLLKTSAAPCALLLAALIPPPAHAQSADQATRLDEIIVTAARNPEDPPVVAETRARLSRTPGAVAVVSAESYRDRYAPNLADVLRDVPGVYAEKKWGGDIRLSIRGSGIGNSSHNRGTLLAQDGIPFNEADGFGDFQLIDPSIARYTEVYKGGNALRFGGALLGGAINLVTPTGRTAGAEDAFRIDGGSFGTLRAHAEVARTYGDWDVFVAATGQKADGWRDQSNGQQQYGSLNIGRRFGEDREVRLYVSGGYVHQEIPGSVSLSDALTRPPAANATNKAMAYQRDMASMRSTLQTRWRLNEETVFEGGIYGTWKDLDHPIFQVVDQQSRNYGVFGRLDWTGQAFGKTADAFYGVSYRSGDLDANQWINLAGSHGAHTAQSRQNATGLDVFAEGRLFVTDRLALVAGGSYGRAERDYQSFVIPGVSTTFNLTTGKTYDWFAPRLGLLWQSESGAQAYANVTRSVEPPNFSALSPDAAGFKPLVPQEAVTYEAGVRGKHGAFTWDVSVYRARLEHELLNFVADPARGLPATFNAGPTTHQGIEAGLDWRFAPRWRLRQTYAFSDFHFDGDADYGDRDLPVVPPHLYRAELRYDAPQGWFVAPSLEWSMADSWVDYQNTLKAPSYAVASLNAGWTSTTGVRLFLDVRNLTDERYISNFSAVTNARLPTVSTAVFFPGEGRSVFVGVSRSF
ncbi:TonB-dependent receptor family protein [Brevundimonas goettingensis]|uniref:TonB-dependent receptor n=1 Tax=Brevundimonas goettingensis TaxID=2774190 RepID=A0A975BYG1_9CAUL|nr:TonB-dependent receptor [Brevundimonas goettingensis]QTC90018.1 TonB-dependent receptor [Brevundimonas goettingensis]